MVKQLSKNYQHIAALDSINAAFPLGSCTLLAGTCGSGKSVLLRLLAGLEPYDAGEIWLNNEQLKPTMHTYPISLLMQETHMQLFGESVWQDVQLTARMAGYTDEVSRQLTTQALATFNLLEVSDRNPLELSGGQMRQVLLAGMLIRQSPVILMDEPFANLDYPSVLQLRSAITTLMKQGKTIIIATHEIEKVINLANYLMIMQAGRVMVQQHLIEASTFTWEQFNLKNPFSPAWQW